MQVNSEQAQSVVAAVNRIILGKSEVVREVMLAFLANGHILIEDVPGVGKTMLAAAFARIMSLESRRVQFTPDVMPSDLTGFSVYRRDEEKFVYQPGTVFCNLLLADELNRTSPKTQSALLEVMEERQVTVEGITRPVPDPFLVIATQNPFGAAGTQRLPESQVDRFMISLSLGYPDYESELQLAREVTAGNRLDQLEPLLSAADLTAMQAAIHEVYIKDSVYKYILDLVLATRSHPLLERGANPRATVALVKMSKAAAWYEGRDYVHPHDVSGQFPFVVRHRILPEPKSLMEEQAPQRIIKSILDEVKAPPLGGRLG